MNFWQNLPKPFTALAPMQDVTDVVFREIIAQTAPPDVFFTEFTPVDGLLSDGYDKTVRNLLFTENQRPIVAQLWGADPDNFYKASKMVSSMGVDGIDINMGCPVKNIVKTGAGAALIKDLDRAEAIIEATKDGAGDVPVSVKTRIGYSNVITNEWIGTLLSTRLAAITVHGRTAKQMSKGEADWRAISEVVTMRDTISPGTVVIGNGDVTSSTQVIERHKSYGVDGVMIGRGVFYNPWVFDKNPREHTNEEYLALLNKHMNMFCTQWDVVDNTSENYKNFQVLKKFFKVYLRGFDGAAELRRSLMSCRNKEEVCAVLDAVVS